MISLFDCKISDGFIEGGHAHIGCAQVYVQCSPKTKTAPRPEAQKKRFLMPLLTLSNSTGVKKIDNILCGIVGLLEIVFPDQIQGYYVTGSYCDGTAVSTSDIDLTVVYKGSNHESHFKRLEEIREHISLFTSILIDIRGASEERIIRNSHRIKLASLFIFGEDIRERIPLVPMEEYPWRCVGAPIFFMTRIARNSDSCIFPLSYPNPSEEFYGYDYDPIENQRDTKVLMAIVGNIATSIIALKAKEYVRSKGECLRQYKQHINDEWTDLLEEVYEVFRNQWEYCIPKQKARRNQLQAICKRTLAFENHFLKLYRNFLIEELTSERKMYQLRALRSLSEIIFPDESVLNAIRLHAVSEDDDLRQTASMVIDKIRKSSKS